MLQKTMVLVMALSLALSVGIVGGSMSGSTPALAAPGNGGGASGLAHFCQFAKANNEFPFPVIKTVGACVSTLTSQGNSNAAAPGLCDYIAAYEGGYPINFVYFNDTTSPEWVTAANKGQCVSFFAQNGVTPEYVGFIADLGPYGNGT